MNVTPILFTGVINYGRHHDTALPQSRAWSKPVLQVEILRHRSVLPVATAGIHTSMSTVALHQYCCSTKEKKSPKVLKR